MTEELTITTPDEKEAAAPVDALLARVQSMPRRRNLRGWLVPSFITVGIIAAMIVLGATGNLDKSAWPALLSVSAISGGSIWYWLSAERRESHLIGELAECDDVRAVPGLLSCLGWYSRRLREAVIARLLVLLPRLTVEDSRLLGLSHRESLNTLLYGDSADLTVAALYALQQVGDGTAVPYLTSIAAGKGIPNSLRNRKAEAQDRAGQTLEIIRGRIDAQNRASVLLRASDVPGASPEQLVRPVSGRPTDDGAELLRADTDQPAQSGMDQKEESF